ncbi:MAG: EFR1 family ferrodoxin [Sarcina sp.]
MEEFIVVLYFSGTGNTKYVANKFAEKMKAKSYSIEEKINFKKLILNSDVITFCYPIYGSCVPSIMMDFVDANKSILNNKKLIILSTQMMFSGDGSRVFVDLLEGVNFEVIYAEHFNMPLNIPNIPLVNVKNGKKLNKKIKKVDKKLDGMCKNIEAKVVKKRGFNKFSEFIGYNFQRRGFSKFDNKIKNGVKITDECILCEQCVRVCPKNNLFMGDKKLKTKGQCTACNRCVNICPKKAITVLYHGKVRKQYKGIK